MNELPLAERRAQNGQALAAQAPADHPIALEQDTTALLAVIAKAASDPTVDVAKMEKLFELHGKLVALKAKAAYYAALSDMQTELPVIEERGEIKIGGNNSPGQKYALWEDINKAIRPILHLHGFAISFRTGIADNKITVTGVLSHREGHSEETTIHLPSDTSGSKNAVQAVGSSTSYGKRYVTAALLNITTGDIDDDGMAAGGDGPIDERQFETLQGLIAKYGVDIEKFCTYYKINALKALPAKKYAEAIEFINLKAKKVGAGDKK